LLLDPLIRGGQVLGDAATDVVAPNGHRAADRHRVDEPLRPGSQRRHAGLRAGQAAAGGAEAREVDRKRLESRPSDGRQDRLPYATPERAVQQEHRRTGTSMQVADRR
jgi:hypothetical protein